MNRKEYRESLGLPEASTYDEELHALRDRVAELVAERDRLREALTMLADGTTPWMDSDPDKPLRESWEVMADYARAALAGKQPQEGE